MHNLSNMILHNKSMLILNLRPLEACPPCPASEVLKDYDSRERSDRPHYYVGKFVWGDFVSNSFDLCTYLKKNAIFHNYNMVKTEN